MGEAIAADHDCNQTCNLRDSAGEKALDCVKPGVERSALCQCGHRHQKEKGEKRGGRMRPFRPKKHLDSADQISFGP